MLMIPKRSFLNEKKYLLFRVVDIMVAAVLVDQPVAVVDSSFELCLTFQSSTTCYLASQSIAAVENSLGASDSSESSVGPCEKYAAQ